jgi:BlaI family penicillinase repressor
MPEGELTAAQFEIMQLVWNQGRQGATVTDIWNAVSEHRDVTRTTILNLVDRLEKRGWLRRQASQSNAAKSANRFFATISQQKVSEQMARGFVDDFFDGSAGNLVMSLIGSRKLNPDELLELRRLLDERLREQDSEPKSGKEQS